MIIKILEFRARLLHLIQKGQLFLIPIVKFLVAFICFHSINKAIGHEPHLMKLPVELVFSFLGTFTPAVILVLLCALVSMAHIYVASPILAILVALLMVILYCFIARFSGKYGYVVLAVPILFVLKIPYLVPLILGLVATPMTIIPMSCGIMVYRMFVVMKSAADMESSTGINDIMALYKDVLDRLVADKEIIIQIIVFALIVVVMYLIRKLSIEYVFEISVAAGAIVGILGFLLGDMYLHTQLNITSMVLGMVVAMLITLIFQFFRLALDYSAVERVQFEDDDYYYYVKAVPKIKLTIPKRRVKKISTSETMEPDEMPENQQKEEPQEISVTQRKEEEERYAMGEEIPETEILEETEFEDTEK